MPQVGDTLHCHKCVKDRNKMGEGIYTCYGCGETAYGLVQEFIPQIWMYKKSVHSRLKWFRKFASKYVDREHIGPLTDDFSKVVGVMKENSKLQGRNVSRYGYYLKRLASRRNIKLTVAVNDLKPNGKTIIAFDDILFGKVYPLLGWKTPLGAHKAFGIVSWKVPPTKVCGLR